MTLTRESFANIFLGFLGPFAAGGPPLPVRAMISHPPGVVKHRHAVGIRFAAIIVDGSICRKALVHCGRRCLRYPDGCDTDLFGHIKTTYLSCDMATTQSD